MEEILEKACLQEELTAEENLQLERWLSKSEANRRLYYQMRMALLIPVKTRREELKADIWSDLNEQISKEKRTLNSSRNSGIAQWLKLAAMIAILGTLVFISYGLWKPVTQEPSVVEVKYIEKVSLPGQRVTTRLNDGTIVKLNSGSQLIVPDSFTEDSREVSLKGEAFFDVASDSSRPFRINTKDVKVEVLGTSFNVKSYPEDDNTEVAVLTGKVSVSKDDSVEYLAPGERIYYSSLLGLGQKQAFNIDEVLGWKDNLLVFRNENLKKVTDDLTRWYGVEFEINCPEDQLKRSFSGRYKDPSLKMILEGISYVYDLNYTINGKAITLKSK